jgi:peptidoglycan hydrolase-like protein with peptidoglycan-binding domain
VYRRSVTCNLVKQIGISIVAGALIASSTPASAWPLGAKLSAQANLPKTPALLLLVQNETDTQGTSIEQVQTDLKRMGLYEGAVDGVAGQGTWNALERFWAIAGLEVGDLTTFRALQIGATADIFSARSVSIEEALKSADELVVVRNGWQTVHDLFSAGDYQNAENWARKLSEMTGRILGDTHPETFRARSSLANLIEAEGRLPEAEGLFRQILADRERVLGPKHPDTLASLGSVLRCVLAQGKEDEARVVMGIMVERNAK